MNDPGIAPAELHGLIEALGKITDDPPGVTRLVYRPAWRSAHQMLGARARSLGLVASDDAAGNLYFHPADVLPREGRAALLIGSHLDSVVHGGVLDGAYGVISALLIASELAGRTKVPVVGFATCEEDEARFGNRMMGVRSLLGLARVEELDAVKDAAGVSWRDALDEARSAGCAAPPETGERVVEPLFRPAKMLELHIEQGPVLESAGEAIGIVDRIAGYRRLRLRVMGEARHAGTTPLRARHDALAAAAEMVLAAEKLAAGSDEAARVTAGNLRVEPGNYNVVPGLCDLWIEARHGVASTLEALVDQLDHACRAIANRRGVRLSIDQASAQPPTTLDSALVDRATSLARRMGLKHRRMASGAGHDAMVFAQQGVPTLMVFVPSAGGVSHAPEEHTAPGALWNGYQFTRDLAAQLASDPA
jgi:hydantoinase/carbamoylase family amidase